MKPVVPLLLLLMGATPAWALPTGYVVWSKGTPDDPSTRKIFRLKLPDRTDEQALTAGEDIEPQISPDGKWVAYAKAKFPGGSDYHDFRLWRIFIVSIHGVGPGRREIKIDDDGAWPGWGKGGALYYNQADGAQSRVVRVDLDPSGRVARRQVVVATKDLFATFAEVNEISVAPDETWFAARTRGNAQQNGVFALTLKPPISILLARAGSIGCMPRVSPTGSFAIIAGATEGIRWGHSPHVGARKEDQLLIAPLSAAHKVYHPGFSSDARWVLAAQGTSPDHNSGRYDLYIHTLDPATIEAGDPQPLVMGGFNGWPDLWVGEPNVPPPPRPEVADFYPSTYTVGPGDPVILYWNTFGADEVRLEDQTVSPEGQKEIKPLASTRYTLLARNAVVAEADTRTVSITVNETPQKVSILRFGADPARVEKGRSTTLSWDVGNVTTLDVGGHRAAPIETREIVPLETTTYVLTANGWGGPVQASVTVVVEAQKDGLLPDRGGFACGASPPGRPLSTWGLILLLTPGLILLAIRVSRRRG